MRATGLAIGMTALVASATFAQDAASEEDFIAFTDDRFTATLTFNAVTDADDTDVQMTGPTFSAGVMAFDNLLLGFEVSGLFVEQDEQAAAVNVSALLRHHVLPVGEGTLFLDVLGGYYYSGVEVPADGTHSNLTFQSGVGLTYPLRDDLHLIGGVRYYHLSNAARRGADENPSINGVSGYVGVAWTF